MGSASAPTRIDRYELYGEIASGGMATVHLGRLVGPAGFGRTVAIKRLHPHLAKEPEFVTMLTDEARVAGRIGHPNIVSTLDIVAADGEVFLVMEYVAGLTLSALLRRAAAQGDRIPVPIANSIMAGVLHGLHAVHEARDENGRPLEVVHRDVSPQNIMVGVDGVARVLDFGIAKAAGRLHTTRDGQLKGKVGYMAPEQLGAGSVDRRTDIYAASVVLWEVLTGERLFEGDDAATVFGSVMQKKVTPPSEKVPDVPYEIDQAVMRGLEREPMRRFPRARDIALLIESTGPLARASEVGEWVALLGEDLLHDRAQQVADIEAHRGQAATKVVTKPVEKPETFATVVEARPGRKPTRRLVTILAAGVALATTAAVSALLARRLNAPPAPIPTPAATSERAEPPAAQASLSVSDVPAFAPAAVPAEPNAAPASTPAPAGATRPVARPKTPKPPGKTDSCNPPFTIEADGKKIYKRECIR
jgi:serine/threonine-protein kinase